ncbi:YggS family pyridoxal phosphate-dependent enzyme [Sporomusa sp.]|uniref:YggS family pyridoxal phosphate-dependent enzyme n=1 Tax=Sporomusa sp. TaxID=2078658 RepID=UPI002C9BB67A|nr:YggS family pyridoxal phosphate-dependent enzyme [Sporomusa sp.]HWR44753.1 YggS family pyridoxal phosphate-dependent enzyme [Sporomusa sp.]
MSIAQNIAEIQKKIDINKVKLVVVTKNHSASAILEAMASGIIAVGENRVQEMLTKYPAIQAAGKLAEWHLIGHLQTNKVRQAVPLADLIHSVDSERLAIEIDKVAGKLGKRQDVLLQVNIADEESKFGIEAGQALPLANFISRLEHIRLCGLMTIAPFSENPETVRPVFKEMYRLFSELKTLKLANTEIKWLSMGMTNDYMVAIEEGANLVRIGTGIFGSRQY